MRISDVQHQPRAHRIIQRALGSQRMPHAYLFAGPDGVGKEMLALGLAQTLLCPSPMQAGTATAVPPGSQRGGRDAHPPEGEALDACGVCRSDLQLQEGLFPGSGDFLLQKKEMYIKLTIFSTVARVEMTATEPDPDNRGAQSD